MKKSTTDSFILELKLQASREDLKFLDRVFYYGFRLYNTMVKHAIKQISKLRKDPQYQEAIKLYKSKKNTSTGKENPQGTCFLLWSFWIRIPCLYRSSQKAIRKFPRYTHRPENRYCSMERCREDPVFQREKVAFQEICRPFFDRRKIWCDRDTASWK